MTNFPILNFGRNIELWVIVACVAFISHIFFTTCGKKISDTKSNLIRKIVKFVDYKLRYKYIIRLLFQSFIGLILSSYLTLFGLHWRPFNYRLLFLNLTGLLGIVFGIYLPIRSFDLIYKNRHSLATSEFGERYRTLMLEVNHTKPASYHNASIFLFRRAVFGWIMVASASEQETQCALLIALMIC